MNRWPVTCLPMVTIVCLLLCGSLVAAEEETSPSAAQDAEALRKKAVAGDPAAQCALGRCYVNGSGVRADAKEALNWLRKAADQGNREAAFEVGNLHYFMLEHPRQVREAAGLSNAAEMVERYTAAAKAGHLAAQAMLSDFYYYGKYVPRDQVQCVAWLTEAAKGGRASSQYALGRRYSSGIGVQADPTQAEEWLRKAAAGGSLMAKEHLARMTTPKLLSGLKAEQLEAAASADAEAAYCLGLYHYHLLADGNPRGSPEKMHRFLAAAAKAGHARAQDILACGLLETVPGGGAKDEPDLPALRKMADAGDAEAQYRLGLAHYQGLYAKLSPELILDLWTRASRTGHAAATFMLGKVYGEGLIVNEDRAKGIDLWQKAASKGSAEAMTKLAKLYSLGTVLEWDPAKALNLFRSAADRGNSEAQFLLGVLYSRGWLTAKDEKKAFDLYAQAAAQGDCHAQFNLGHYYYSGQLVKKDPNKAFELWTAAAALGQWAAQVNLFDTTCIDETRRWWPGAAEKGDAGAMCCLGLYYGNTGGWYGKPDFSLALPWFAKSARQGCPKGYLMMGECCNRGWGRTCDPLEATLWWRKAAKCGLDDAWQNMACQQLEGAGVPQDINKAVECLVLGALWGSSGTRDDLSRLYEEGWNGVAQDESKAKRWFEKYMEAYSGSQSDYKGHGYLTGERGYPKDERKAVMCFLKSAEQWNPRAMNHLGWCYETGSGVEKDLKKARDWYMKATAFGDNDAQKRAERIEKQQTSGKPWPPPPPGTGTGMPEAF